MEQHFRTLGWLFVIFGILGLIIGLLWLAALPRLMATVMEETKRGGWTAPTPPTAVPGYPGAPTGPAGSYPTPGVPTPEAVQRIVRLIMGPLVAVLVIVQALWILDGWALLTRRGWARVLTIVLSILSLPSLPVGTAIGIYGLWVTLSGAGAAAWEDYVAGSRPIPYQP